jgi:hypothetical protein
LLIYYSVFINLFYFIKLLAEFCNLNSQISPIIFNLPIFNNPNSTFLQDTSNKASIFSFFLFFFCILLSSLPLPSLINSQFVTPNLAPNSRLLGGLEVRAGGLTGHQEVGEHIGIFVVGVGLASGAGLPLVVRGLAERRVPRPEQSQLGEG